MSALSRHQRVVIACSVLILREGVTRCADGRVDTVHVRLALRCLLHHCPETWPLALYWDAAAQDNEIGRAQGVTALFNGIVRQLRRAGFYKEKSPSSKTRKIALFRYRKTPPLYHRFRRKPAPRRDFRIALQGIRVE